MLGRTYEDENCSAARALEVAGERWSLLILRDAIFRGITRFSDFQRSLGVATNVLASRLDLFLSEGLMELRRSDEYSDQGSYELTEKGRDFHDVVVALTAWGDKWNAPHGPPIEYRHRDCGGSVALELRCAECAMTLQPGDTLAKPGSGRRGNKRRTTRPR